ncbi:cytochrome P450 [Obba rivulosa]|uniref:Cytochrome P450 n=1 Tax=Obba rivulosa TaxID=1052685 RepID=A0A8E2DTY0_9APHY|nr:cytochrome P450 [Obba rivulosa]
MSLDTLIVVFSVLCAWMLVFVVYRARRRGPLPPGPSGKPLVGNIFEVMPRKDWSELALHQERYGNLTFFHGCGTKILLLNSIDAIRDLLEKRAATMSDRPFFTVSCEMFGGGQSMAFLPYSDEWRRQRRLARTVLGPGSVKQFHGVQEDISAIVGKQLLEDPEQFFKHIRLATGRLILAITYGLSVTDADDEYITLAESTLKAMGESVMPGAYLANHLPFLKHLPSWIPSQREILRIAGVFDQFVTKPYEHVKRHMRENKAVPSFVQQLLLEAPETTDMAGFEHSLKWAAGSMYAGNVETVPSTVLTFVYAMMAHPDKQRLAQEDLDKVVGGDRLPVVADREKLPYVDAVIKETMRWSPAVPMGFPRCLTEDEFYNGFHIPKGTMVFPIAWNVAHEYNPKYDHRAFIPERFLDPDVPTLDPTHYAFGFGRRICPGKYLAEDELFLLIATILATFTMEQPAEGLPALKFNVKTNMSYPEPFPCRFTPRSEAKARAVLDRAAHVDMQSSPDNA